MFLPTSLPDETLFSRYVRHMTIMGLKEQDYLKLIFNKPRVSIHPYLTIGIEKASKISSEDILCIYKQQTLGSFFSYFIPNKSDVIYKAMLQEDGGQAFRASQLANFKESESLSLKYCPLCSQEDMKNFGVSYWHLIHQIPGVEACSMHRVWLVHQELPERPHLKLGLLPNVSTTPQKCTGLSYEFAKFSHQWLNKISSSSYCYDQDVLVDKLRDYGYVLGTKRFKRAELTSLLFSFTNKLDNCDKRLLPESESDYRYLSYLLSGHTPQHPFKYILVEFWINHYLNPINIELTKNEKNVDSIKNEKIELQCINLLLKNVSLAEISRRIGKSRCYVKSVAMKQNIPFQKKPYILTDEIIKKIIFMAYKGFHRQAIARKFHISTGSVEQIISSEEGLVERRKRYKFESKRRRYKIQILRTLQQKPLAKKQEIKTSCYAAFHWLYTNEKHWLNKTLPSPTRPRVHSKVIGSG